MAHSAHSSHSETRVADSALLYGILDLGYVSEEMSRPVTAALLAGGVGLLQLRAKGQDQETIRRVALSLIPLCQAVDVPFILNDFPALAGEVGADGVHIGQDDGSLADARGTFLANRPASSAAVSPLVGRSTHSLEQARAALEEGADYIGFGPLFPTPTKQGRPGIGIDDIREMQRDVGSRIPAFCIGGIKRENLGRVIAAGARRVVIVSDLLTANDPCAASRDVVAQLIAECGLRNAD